MIRNYLEWIASLPWDKIDRGQPRPRRTRARCSTPTTTTSRRSRTASSSSSPCRRLKPDARGSILCFVGPPGVGKTSLGPLDRARARAPLRAHQRRRHARRGRDPRPPAHLHRRDARHDHPRAARRGLEQPAVHDRRDRQDGLGLPRRPGVGDARGARPRAERDLPRPLPRRGRSTSRRSCSSRRRTRSTRSPGPLRDRMEIIQLAGYTEEEKLQIAKRYLVPRQIERNGLKKSQIAFTDAGLRAIISDYTREAGVRNLEREIGSVCRKVGAPGRRGQPRAQADRDRAACARAARPAALPARRAAAHARAGRGDRPRVDARSAATSCSSRRPRCPATRASAAPDRHRPARRRDARVRAGGAVLCARARARARARAARDFFATHDIHLHVPRARRPRTARAPASRWRRRSCRSSRAARCARTPR